jgi:hypothetical protein
MALEDEIEIWTSTKISKKLTKSRFDENIIHQDLFTNQRHLVINMKVNMILFKVSTSGISTRRESSRLDQVRFYFTSFVSYVFIAHGDVSLSVPYLLW